MQSYAVEGRASRSEARDRFESGADGPRSGARGETAADTFTAAGSRYRTDLPRAETGFLGSSMPHAITRGEPPSRGWRGPTGPWRSREGPSRRPTERSTTTA